jgi:ubiquinone/menaquinone biosynthesis C-methylase UbiE
MNSIVADWYEKKEHVDEMIGWDKGKLKIWEQQVADCFPHGAKILDIGSGMGREAFTLYRQGFEVTGLDISKYAVDKANEDALKRDCKVKFYHYDGEHIPFEDGMYDIVVIWNQTFGLLYGDIYKENYIRECKRVLKPEGMLSYSGHSLQYISEHYKDYLEGNKFYPYKGRDIYWETFTLEELEKYASQASFKILRSGEGEIYKPEDGIILYCLTKKKLIEMSN